MSSRFQVTNCKQSKMTVPLTIALVGDSYCGKTCSAHRLSQGIKRVHGGPVVYIDTEGGRALEFKNRFDFEHLPFEEPYGSLDYCAAIDAALEYKPSCIIIDSLTHEHEGIGSYMWVSRQETERGVKSGQNFAKPSGYRTQLLSKLNTLPCSTILCMRAKVQRDWESVFTKKSKEPVEMGYGAIGGSDFVFMATCRILLKPEPPRSKFKGAPVWDSVMPAEVATMKLGPFEELFSERRQLSESDGEYMARWAQGMAGEVKKQIMTVVAMEHLTAMRLAMTDEQMDLAVNAMVSDKALSAAESNMLDKSAAKHRQRIKDAVVEDESAGK